MKLAKPLAIASMAFSAPVFAYDVTQDCSDRNPTALYECSYYPHIIEDWRYRIPGPIHATLIYKKESEAKEEFRQIYTASRSWCTPPQIVGESDYYYNWGGVSEPSWKPDLVSYQRKDVTYFGIPKSGDDDCGQATSLTVHLYASRALNCGPGWYRRDDPAQNVTYCYRPSRPACEPEGGNPIAVASSTKVQREQDYKAPNGDLSFVRIYRSSGKPIFRPQGGDLWADAGLGQFWSHNYEMRLQITSWSVWMSRGDGPAVHFRAPSGIYPEILTPLNAGERGRLVAHSPQEFLYYTADNRIERYMNGLLESIHNGGGSFLRFSHTPSGRLSSVENFAGRKLTFFYSSEGKLQRFEDPAGGVTSYDYKKSPGEIGTDYTYLHKVTRPDFTSRIYHTLDGQITNTALFPHLLQGITDENGVRYSTYTYGSNGHAAATELAGGVNRWTLSNGSALVSPLGAYSNYNFTTINGVRLLTSQSQPAGAGCNASSSSISYDSQANVVSRNDFTGKRTCYAHDASRKLETTRVEGLNSWVSCGTYIAPGAALPSGSRKVSTEWHPDWRLETRVAEPGRMTTTVYNGQPDPFAGGAVASCAPASALLPDGKPIAVACKRVEQATTDVDGSKGFSATVASGVPARTWSYTYNQYGQVLTEDGPRTDVADVTTYEYYTDTTADWTVGDLKQVTNAAGQITRFTRYNPHGQVLQTIDANGVVTDSTYDLRQRLTTVSTAGQTTTYEYEPTGLLKRVTQPDQSFVEYHYDDAHRLTGLSDHLGNSVTYTLDNAGNRTAEEVKDPGGTLTRNLNRAFDALGRVQQTTGSLQ